MVGQSCQALHEPSLLLLLSQTQYVKTKVLALVSEVNNEIFNTVDPPGRLAEHQYNHECR